jgi:uncharacterized membrane protein required for colicin V production
MINAADAMVVLGLVLFSVRGYKTGFVNEFLSFTAALVALAAAFRWTEMMVPRVADGVPGSGSFETSLVFLGIFGLVLFACRKVAVFIKRMWVSVGSSPTNRMAGMSFGFFKGMVLIGLTLIALRQFGPQIAADAIDERSFGGQVGTLHRKVEESKLAVHVADLTGGMFSALMSSAEGSMRRLASGGDDAAAGP